MTEKPGREFAKISPFFAKFKYAYLGTFFSLSGRIYYLLNEAEH
jgi:hypothetical protein